MKSKYWAAILGLLLAGCLGLSLFLGAGSSPADRAEIRSDGQVLRVVDLNVEQEFTVSASNGGENVITVRDGKIAVTQADCPDGYCMDRGFCNSGTQIVCLPNSLVITFLGDDGIDGAIG